MKKFLLSSLVYSLAACSVEMKPDTPVAPSKTDTSDANSAQLTYQKPRPVVSVALDLDSTAYRINGLRAGMQDYMNSKSPAITYLFPDNADYVEILRCSSNISLKSGFGTLKDIELGARSATDEAAAMASSDFWHEATQAGCTLLTNDFSGQTFIDASAQSGVYVYLARACVAEERVGDKEIFSNRNCSKYVTVSPELKYLNQRAEDEREALEDAARVRDLANGLGRKIYTLTVQLNNALIECNEQNVKRETREKRRAAITKILGYGLSLGGTFVDDMNASSDSMSLGQSLTNLFVSTADYPKTCTAALYYQNEGKIAALELQEHKKLYASLMERVTQTAESRAALEK